MEYYLIHMDLLLPSFTVLSSAAFLAFTPSGPPDCRNGAELLNHSSDVSLVSLTFARKRREQDWSNTERRHSGELHGCLTVLSCRLRGQLRDSLRISLVVNGYGTKTWISARGEVLKRAGKELSDYERCIGEKLW